MRFLFFQVANFIKIVTHYITFLMQVHIKAEVTLESGHKVLKNRNLVDNLNKA